MTFRMTCFYLSGKGNDEARVVHCAAERQGMPQSDHALAVSDAEFIKQAH